jgi:hypothetical protein
MIGKRKAGFTSYNYLDQFNFEVGSAKDTCGNNKDSEAFYSTVLFPPSKPCLRV